MDKWATRNDAPGGYKKRVEHDKVVPKSFYDGIICNRFEQIVILFD